jgi:hypothetical protein
LVDCIDNLEYISAHQFIVSVYIDCDAINIAISSYSMIHGIAGIHPLSIFNKDDFVCSQPVELDVSLDYIVSSISRRIISNNHLIVRVVLQEYRV